MNCRYKKYFLVLILSFTFVFAGPPRAHALLGAVVSPALNPTAVGLFFGGVALIGTGLVLSNKGHGFMGGLMIVLGAILDVEKSPESSSPMTIVDLEKDLQNKADDGLYSFQETEVIRNDLIKIKNYLSEPGHPLQLNLQGHNKEDMAKGLMLDTGITPLGADYVLSFFGVQTGY